MPSEVSDMSGVRSPEPERITRSDALLDPEAQVSTRRVEVTTADLDRIVQRVFAVALMLRRSLGDNPESRQLAEAATASLDEAVRIIRSFALQSAKTTDNIDELVERLGHLADDVSGMTHRFPDNMLFGEIACSLHRARLAAQEAQLFGWSPNPEKEIE